MWANIFKQKGDQVRLGLRKNLFTGSMVQHWHKMPQELVRCPIPGTIPDQVGQSSEQPDLLKDVPVHCRPLGPDDLYSSLPAQPSLGFLTFHLNSTKIGGEEKGAHLMPWTSVHGECIPQTLFHLQPLCILPAGAAWQTSAAPHLSSGSSSGTPAAKARRAWAASAVGSVLWLSGVEPGEKRSMRFGLLLSHL